ncbi:MAG: glycosyltransferase family 4 protein [Jatrophihabitantaceae bacterium]
MDNVHAVTIAARNYLALARTLARSFLAANPDSRFSVLVVDALPGEVPSTDGFEVLTPHELCLDPAEFTRMALLYDVTELSTALKPWALELLLDRGAEVAVYLDPDIYVYSALDEIEHAALDSGILLTPHTVSPMRRDNLRPSEADIMGAGVYNLGFIAVNKDARAMLGWWQERLRRDSISAPEQMLFTDQRWIDLVPGYFDHGVLRDPGYNVAYWNLDSRQIEWDGQGYEVNSQPLRFFHFSGYSPDTPWILSKYVADRPRVLLSEHPTVRRLCDEYAATLRQEGFDRSLGTPYRFGRLNDGTAVSPMMRRAYRSAVVEAELAGNPYPPAPFNGDDAEVLAWFSAPVAEGSWVNRLVQSLWQSRSDLQLAFPDIFGADQAPLLAWCLTSGVREAGLSAALLPTEALGASDALPVTSSDVLGVNLAGYFRTETGVGQIGRLLADVVRATGLPHVTVTSARSLSRQQASFTEEVSEVRYPITIASINADQFPLWANEAGSSMLAGRYTIGVWAWEVEDFPDCFDTAIGMVDEIWAISEFVRAAIARKTDKPVHVIPYPVPELSRTAELDRAALGLPEQPYLLYMFDYFSVFERKNPVGLVEAFTAAFADGQGPALVIKSVNSERFRSQREQLLSACRGRSDIHLIEGYLDAEVVESLITHCAAYVSLHRAEGLGLTMSEAMSAGRPVIATGYSGNLDFMNDENSLLVGYCPVEIPACARPYGPPTRWAEPDLAEAARHLRWVFSHPAEAAQLGLRAQESMRSSHDLDRSVSFVMRRLRQIEQSRAAERSDPDQRAQPAPVMEAGPAPALRACHQLLDTPLRASARPGGLSGASRFFQRALNRVLARHDEQLNIRLNAILDATGAVHERAESQRSSAAESLREVRQTVAQLQAAAGQQHSAISGLQSLATSLGAHHQALTDRTDRLSTMAAEAGAESSAQTSRLDALGELADGARLDIEGHRRQLVEVVQRLDAIAARLTEPHPQEVR